MPSSQEHRTIRFGPFEADSGAGELRKDGRVVRLQEQPFQVLLALLDRSGEVVTREELRERLWPGDSFGEFDQGLNTAINKLREALGDSAANPRFVETLPKRGYRFVHAIEADAATPAEAPVPVKAEPARYGNYIAAVLAVVVCILAVMWIRRTVPDPQLPLRRFTLRFEAPTSATPDMRLVAVSPDGKRIAIINREKKNTVWIQDLDRQQPRMVDGTEGATTVFWSPDSSMIGFVADFGLLKKVSLQGGPAIPLCQRPPISGGSWSPDGGSVVFASGTPSSLYVVPATGGTPTLVVSPQMLAERLMGLIPRPGPASGWISHPQFLPAEGGSQKVLFSYLGRTVSFNDAALVVRDLKSGVQHALGAGSNATYSPSGHLVYRSGSDLWARPFSLQQARFEGEAVQVARMATDPSVADDGTLVYRDLVTSQLVWLDRRGARTGTAGLPSDGFYYPALSPDGRRVAVEALENESLDVWVVDIERRTRIRVSSHPATEILPTWSPAGEQVAYGSYRAGNIDIFGRDADAVGAEATLRAGPLNERVSDWSRDGQYILYWVDPKSDIWYLQRNSGGKWEPHPLLETPANERSPKFSPDGRYVAYISDESGRDELYVREFPAGGRKWPVSTSGASQIRWSRNGRELFYTESGTLIAVPVSTAGGFAAGPPSRLFSHPGFTNSVDPNYDVMADGQRIILPERVGEQERMIHVVQNWFAEFRDRR